jgi:hypothetical protein
MLSRRDCMRLVPVGFFLPSFLVAIEKVGAQDALPLGLDTFYRQISADGKSELICYTDVDLTGGLVPGDRTTTVLADRITISGVFARPGLDLTLLAREIVCATGGKIDLSGSPPLPTNPKAKNGLSPGAKGDDGGVSVGGNRGGNLVIYAGTITGMLAVQSDGGAGADAENGGDGAKGATGSAWTVIASAGNGGRGGAAGKAGTPGAGGNGGNVVVSTLDTTFANVTAVLSHGAAGAPGNNGNPGAGGDPGPGGSGYKTVLCGTTCTGTR